MEKNIDKELVGRDRERRVLQDAMDSHRSELVAVYGRRRIGKTYLIREFFKGEITFSFTGLSDGNRKEQIKNFVLKLNEDTDDFLDQKMPKDWLEAFSVLKTYINERAKKRK